MDDQFLNQKTNNNIGISYSLKYKHSEKNIFFTKKQNQKTNSTMSVVLCMGANFAKKNSCLVARIFLYYTAGLHLLTFHILDPSLHLVSVMLSQINGIITVHLKFYLNQCFQVSQLLKYDGNIVVKYVFSMPCCGKGFLKPSYEA